MKKFNLLAIAAASVLTLGGLAGCGAKDDPVKPGPDIENPDKPNPDKPEEVVQEQLEIKVTDENTEYQVGQKAKFEFQVGGKALEDKGKLINNDFKVEYSAEGIALLREWDGYVAFSKPGKVKITVSGKFYKPATVEFTVVPRVEVEGKTNLIISGPAKHTAFMEEMAAKYNETLADDKKINFIFEDHGEDKVDSEILDWKQGPDIFAFASDKIAELYKKGALSKLPAASVTHIKDTMTPASQIAATFPTPVDYLAYPYAGDNGYYLFYNKAEVTEAQTATIEGLMDLALEKGKKVAYPLNTAFYSAGALFTFGSRYSMEYDDNGKLAGVTADFDSPDGIKAGKAILKIMQHKAYQETQAAPMGDLIACVDGSWNAQAYKDKLGENFACTKLPTVTIDGTTKNLSSFLGYKLYGVNRNKDAERVQAAHDFATFLTNEATQLERFNTFSIAPTNKALSTNEAVLADPAIKAINAQAEFAVPQTAVPANVWSAPVTFTQSIIEGNVTESNIEQYMQALNKSIRESK